MYNPHTTLNNPWRQQTQVAQVLPIPFDNGTNSGPRSASFPIDTSITFAGSAHYGSGEADSNGRIGLHIFHNRHGWKPYHTGDAQLTFVKCTPSDYAKCKLAIEYELMGLSQMNSFHRYDKAWKLQFNQQSARTFKKEWSFLGVQQGDSPAYSDVQIEQRKQNFYFGKRAVLPNIWSALCSTRSSTRSIVNELDDLFLIIQRVEQDIDGEDIPDAKKLRSGSGAAVSVNPNREKEYYWRIIPYVSHDRRPPPVHLYSNRDFRHPERNWVGDFIRIGKATGMTGGGASSALVVGRARDAIFPVERSGDYKTPLYLLPHVEVFLKVT